jgi:creatinine amidohydrolase
MSDPISWREGYDVLMDRVARLPEILRTQATASIEPIRVDPRSVHCFVTSGVGSSEAHARYLAHLLAAELGLPARFMPLSELAPVPPFTAERDVLIVFSQGLSPNARPALATPEAWKQVVLATAVTEQRASRPDHDVTGRLLDRVIASGGQVVRFPVEDEYTTLVRVIGPMAGYLCALGLASTIGTQVGAAPFDIDIEAICERLDVAGSATRVAFAGQDLRVLPARLAFLANGAYGELTSNFRYKVLEGMLAPLPPVWDLLHFAHGPFQQSYSHPATFVALTHESDPGEADLLRRLSAMLVPGRHEIVTCGARLPGPLAIFEHEAMLNYLLLDVIEANEIDQVNWPGRGLDAPLYDFGADSVTNGSICATLPECVKPERRLDRITWPELESLLSGGVRTVVIPLGATEQHGVHLPFATDTWIADALAERLCARIEDSLRCPTIPIGCSPEHMAFAGTLSLQSTTLISVLADMLACFAKHGFERAFVFSAHGGNYGPLAESLSVLCAASGKMDLIVFTERDRLTRVFHEAGTRHGVCPESSGHHAGEFETSILRGLAPEFVRIDRLEPGFVEPAPRPDKVFYPDLRANAPNGTVGDPRPSDAGRANHYLDAWVDVLLEVYCDAIKSDRSITAGCIGTGAHAFQVDPASNCAPVTRRGGEEKAAGFL